MTSAASEPARAAHGQPTAEPHLGGRQSGAYEPAQLGRMLVSCVSASHCPIHNPARMSRQAKALPTLSQWMGPLRTLTIPLMASSLRLLRRDLNDEMTPS